MFSKLVTFLKEVNTEMKKVTWPSRKEISGSTVVVIVSVAIVALYLGVVDSILQMIIMRLVSF